MTTLSLYQLPQITVPTQQLTEFSDITALLDSAGIHLERWSLIDLPENADSEAVLAHYQQDIDRLKRQEGYTKADVISVTPTHPDKQALRERFLQEHTHSEDEVRFFVRGSGSFFVPLGEQEVRLTCEAGDLLRVPAHTRHWFDCGAQPDFTAIRIFTNPSGWVGQFTGRKTFY